MAAKFEINTCSLEVRGCNWCNYLYSALEFEYRLIFIGFFETSSVFTLDSSFLGNNFQS